MRGELLFIYKNSILLNMPSLFYDFHRDFGIRANDGGVFGHHGLDFMHGDGKQIVEVGFTKHSGLEVRPYAAPPVEACSAWHE